MLNISEPTASGNRAVAEGGVMQEIGLLTPAPSQSKFTPKPHSRREDDASSSRKDKGKEKAQTGELDDTHSEDDAESVRTTRGSSRPAKRKKTGRSEDSMLLVSQTDIEVEEDTPTLETSFHLLDLADVAMLPSVPVDPAIPFAASAKRTSLYVPPGVAHLIEAMNHALVSERNARRRTEALYEVELGRRAHAELLVSVLAQKNALLEVETRAWANAAAGVLAEQFAALPQPGPSATSSGDAPAEASSTVDAPSTSEEPPRSADTFALLLMDPQRLGRAPDVFERAAAVQRFFQELIPMPAAQQPSPP
ncbi:hypothetical protein DAEQUDRAFT_807075 [Daedalea quercina L-15889]|uniref:Uncharacterized protein n=1 Tax=Daedalea quercina L-15889 TaxID=1314783 RepID=A0A165UDB0_9APHY|nr:hypothetical protein DAEQUDRAFT_807075 [Daedalea quercina L-15889]